MYILTAERTGEDGEVSTYEYHRRDRYSATKFAISLVVNKRYEKVTIEEEEDDN